MKIYLDSKCLNEIQNLDLGIVSAGESQQYTFYVKNDSKASLRELKFNIEHTEVKILEAPKTLDSEEIGKLILKWSPSITLQEGLKTPINIKGKALWSN